MTVESLGVYQRWLRHILSYTKDLRQNIAGTRAVLRQQMVVRVYWERWRSQQKWQGFDCHNRQTSGFKLYFRIGEKGTEWAFLTTTRLL